MSTLHQCKTMSQLYPKLLKLLDDVDLQFCYIDAIGHHFKRKQRLSLDYNFLI